MKTHFQKVLTKAWWCVNNTDNRDVVLRVCMICSWNLSISYMSVVWSRTLFGTVLSQKTRGGGPRGEVQFPGHYVWEGERGGESIFCWNSLDGRNWMPNTSPPPHTHTKIAFLSINSFKCFVPPHRPYSCQVISQTFSAYKWAYGECIWFASCT